MKRKNEILFQKNEEIYPVGIQMAVFGGAAETDNQIFRF